MMNTESIADNIKFLRQQHDWTQLELSRKLNLSRSVIAKWENNTMSPDISSLVKLSDVFEVSLDQIVGTHSHHKDLLKDFKRTYESKSKPFDEDVMEIVQYIMKHPDLKKDFFRIQSMPQKKQKLVHSLIKNAVKDVEAF